MSHFLFYLNHQLQEKSSSLERMNFFVYDDNILKQRDAERLL